MFSFSVLGLTGMFYLMLGHALTSGALFWGIVFYMIDIKHV